MRSDRGLVIVVLLLSACRSVDPAAEVGELLANLRAAGGVEQRLTALHSLSELQPRFLDDAEDPLPVVHGFLDDADPQIVAKAAELLAGWGDRDAVPALVRLLHDTDLAMRSAALTALVKMPDARAREALLGALGDPVAVVRAQACGALARLGDPATLPALRGALHDRDGAVRAAAARGLGSFRQSEDVATLIVLLEDGEAGVADAAATALGRLGDARAVEPLLERLSGGRQSARRAAAVALGRLGDARALPLLLAMLDDDSPALQVAALMSVRQLRDPAAAPRVRILAESEDFNVSFRVPYVLASLYRRESRRQYEHWLTHGTPAMKAAVADGLGYTADADLIPALLGALADRSAYVRANAVRSLGLLGGEDVVPRLTALAADDRSELVRDRARLAVLMIRTPDSGAVARLRSVLDHEDPHVRMDAASVLGLLGAREALPELERMAALEGKWWVRGSVYVALLRFDDPEV